MQPGKKWEELTIQDDFLFKKVMKNRRICTKMLEKILHIKIGKITYHEEEKSIDMRLESKGVRLDVYVQDEQGTVFNIEMQTTSYRNELKLRGRYYQGMIDLDLIDKGDFYSLLNQTYIIFICPFDLFGLKRHIYTFRNLCVEAPKLELDDKTTKIFLNSKGTSDDVDTELKAFLQYVDGVLTEDPFVQELNQEVEKAKNNKEWRSEYMSITMNMWVREQMAKDEGKAEGQKDIIANMLKQNLDYVKIACLTGLPEAEVQALAEELKTKNA